VSGAEAALEAAILEALGVDTEVAALIGSPLRVAGSGGPVPAFPYLEVVRHESVDAGGAGVEASEHRVDLAVVSRDTSGVRVKQAMAAVRTALSSADLDMGAWRCVLLVPVFMDSARSGVQMWRAVLRLKAVIEPADSEG
jgi:hypothetical protein